jgi:hypothetical protein
MTPEACVLRSVLDLLAAKRILAFRNNVGVMRGAHKGKNYFVKFGTVGMADVVCFPRLKGMYQAPNSNILYSNPPLILWIECKSGKGKQTPDQQGFQKIVEAEGHSYVVIRDVNQLISWLKETGL